MKVCEDCNGHGVLEPDETVEGCEIAAECPGCDGTGEVEHDPDDPYDVPGGLPPVPGPVSGLAPAWL